MRTRHQKSTKQVKSKKHWNRKETRWISISFVLFLLGRPSATSKSVKESGIGSLCDELSLRSFFRENPIGTGWIEQIKISPKMKNNFRKVKAKVQVSKEFFMVKSAKSKRWKTTIEMRRRNVEKLIANLRYQQIHGFSTFSDPKTISFSTIIKPIPKIAKKNIPFIKNRLNSKKIEWKSSTRKTNKILQLKLNLFNSFSFLFDFFHRKFSRLR